MINLQLAQQLKTKNVKVVPRKLFCRQCKAKSLLETDSVIDTGNEFTECQTPRKKLQSIGISPASLNAFMKTLKSDISEVCKVQVDYLKDSESDYIQSKSKFLSWYLINGLECTVQYILMSLKTLFELHMKSKK